MTTTEADLRISHPVSSESPSDWDELVRAAPDAHLLQSYRWGEFKRRHGWMVERSYVEAGGGFAAAQVLWRHTPLGAIGYIPRGPVIGPRNNVAAVSKLMSIVHRKARARGAILLKTELNSTDPSPLSQLGFRSSPQMAQPRATLIVDLTQSLDVLLSNMHHKTRYNIHLAQRKGVEIVQGDVHDIPAFMQMMHETAVRDEISIRSQSYYRDVLVQLEDNIELLLAKYQDETLAGIMVGKFNGEAIYLYGASSSRRRNLMPNYLLQWEAMRRAKAQGLARYDLWSVPPELAEVTGYLSSFESGARSLPPADDQVTSRLAGVYRFKRGFGGKLVAYCGAYDHVYSAPRYLVWQKLTPPVLHYLKRAKSRVRRFVAVAALTAALSGAQVLLQAAGSLPA